MAIAKLENWNPANISAPSLSRSLPMNGYAAPALQHLLSDGSSRARATEPKAEWAAQAFEEFRHTGKGVVYALVIEGAAALCACAAWLICR